MCSYCLDDPRHKPHANQIISINQILYTYDLHAIENWPQLNGFKPIKEKIKKTKKTISDQWDRQQLKLDLFKTELLNKYTQKINEIID